MKKGYLVFSDGTYVEGTRMGAEGDTIGELVSLRKLFRL